MVSGGVLDDKALVALNALVDSRLLNGPLANVRPLLVALCVLLGVRGLPPLLPVVGELLEERRLKLGRLYSLCISKHARLLRLDKILGRRVLSSGLAKLLAARRSSSRTGQSQQRSTET